MQLNQIIELDIIDMTDEGSSIGKVDNLTVFLDKGVKGASIRAIARILGSLTFYHLS